MLTTASLSSGGAECCLNRADRTSRLATFVVHPQVALPSPQYIDVSSPRAENKCTSNGLACTGCTSELHIEADRGYLSKSNTACKNESITNIGEEGLKYLHKYPPISMDDISFIAASDNPLPPGRQTGVVSGHVFRMTLLYE